MKWKLTNRILTINGNNYSLNRDYTIEEATRIICNRGSFELTNGELKVGIS